MRAGLALIVAMAACATPPRTPKSPGSRVTLVPASEMRAEVTLVAGDRALELLDLRVDAEVAGPIAVTTMTFGFSGSGPAQEATFAIALPPGASVTSFATLDHVMDVEPKIFELPNRHRFVGRIPLSAEPRQEIRLTYVEALPTAFTPYRAPLAGLPVLDSLRAALRLRSTGQEYVFSSSNHEAPPGDFVVRLPDSRPAVVQNGNYAVARIESAPPTASESIDTLTVLIDSSASHAETYGSDIERAKLLIDRVEPHQVRVAAFDQEVVPLHSLDEAKTRRPLGATRLDAALAWANGASRILVVSDGAFEAPARTTRPRVDVLAPVNHATDALARSGVRHGALFRPSDNLDDAVRALVSPGGVLGPVKQAGSVWPSSLARSGAPSSSALAFVEGHVDARSTDTNVPARFLEQLVVEAHLRELEAERLQTGVSPDRRAALSKEIEALAARLRSLLRSPVAVTPQGIAVLSLPRCSTCQATPPDADGDGVPDLVDLCPAVPAKSDDGCDRRVVVIDSSHDFWLQNVQFSPGSSRIDAPEVSKIDFAASSFATHEELQLIGVFGHADRGESSSEALAQARADAVRRLLIERGVAPARLVAKGVGARRPLEDPARPEGGYRNRAVGFTPLIAYGRSTQSEFTTEFPRLFTHGKLPPNAPPYRGDFEVVMRALDAGDPKTALALAEAWTKREPMSVLSWIALGRAFDANSDPQEAARAYGSILELENASDATWRKPSRDRAVAALLESLAPRHPPALALANALDAPAKPPVDKPVAMATWDISELGAGDVDLVAYDEKGQARWPAEDVDYGGGPETLVLDPMPARLEIQLMALPKSAFAVGKVMILTPPKDGRPTIETRAFVLMNQGSRVVVR